MKAKKAAKAGAKRKRTVVRDLASRKPSDIKAADGAGAGAQVGRRRKSFADPVASRLRGSA